MPTRSLPCYSVVRQFPELVERWVFIRTHSGNSCQSHGSSKESDALIHFPMIGRRINVFARDVAQHLRCPRPRTCQIMNVRWRGRAEFDCNLYMPLPQPLLRAVVLDVNLREPRAQHITPRPRLFGIVVKGKIQKVTFRVDGKKHKARRDYGVEDIARGFGALFERLPKGCQKGDREFRFRR